jgi:predicted permease
VGATRDQAEQEVQSIAATLAADYPATNARWSLHLLSLRDFLVSGGDAEMLFTAVSLVLLVIAANVSSLLIARGLTRATELSLRAALGAGRARLARLLAVEVGVLAVAGGTIGLVVANWGIRAINVWIPEPPPFWARPAIDVRTAAAAFAITTVVALAAGLWPVLRLSRANGGSALSGTRVTAAPSHRRMQRVLVCGQVAVTFALLIGATLLNRSATSLLTADGGFDMARLSSFRFYIAGDAYDEPGRRARAVDNVVQRIAALPGVDAAGATGAIPTDDGGDGIRIATPDSLADRDLAIGGQLVPAGASFWNAIGRRVITGRVFTAAEDVDPEAHVAIVNERLAARLWPGDSAVDRVLRLDGNYGGEYRVVGVAPNLVYEEFGEETGPAELIVYVPLATSGWRTNAVLARTAGEPSLLLGRVRDAVRQVDPGFAVYDERTMPARRRYNHWGSVFLGHAGVTFAWVALLLACVGAYGLAAHGVNERRREIGVRLALGASRRAVVQLFVGLGARLALAGVPVGVVLGLGVARALAHGDELFRTSPWALDVWIGPPLILAAAVVAACFVPARRAARIDPAVTLRAD